MESEFTQSAETHVELHKMPQNVTKVICKQGFKQGKLTLVFFWVDRQCQSLKKPAYDKMHNKKDVVDLGYVCTVDGEHVHMIASKKMRVA